MSSSDIFEVLADSCGRQPKLFLDCPPDGLDRQAQLDSSRPFAVEVREWIRENGDEDPAGWLWRIVASYLAEASHQLSVMALLLKNRAVHATLDPLIRAVLERCGRVCWLLDPDATASQRAARTQLELGVCAHHYAEALSLVDAAEETRTELRQWRGQHRTRVHARYMIDTNGEKKDMSGWSVNGETYANYTGTVAYALDRHPQSPAVYAALSGFSHPNVFFAQERQGQTVVTRNVMVMHTDAIERNLRIALVSHLAAVKRWASYYLDQELAHAVLAEGDRLADALDEASVLPEVPISSDPSNAPPSDPK